MPWWSWFVIWAALVILLFGMLAWLTYRIVTKLFSALSALGELSEKTELLDARVRDLAPDRTGVAVFADRAELAEIRRVLRHERQHRKQTRTEVRLIRGKLLVKADPHQYLHLVKRT